MLGKIFKRESKRERLLQRLRSMRKTDEFESSLDLLRSVLNEKIY